MHAERCEGRSAEPHASVPVQNSEVARLEDGAQQQVSPPRPAPLVLGQILQLWGLVHAEQTDAFFRVPQETDRQGCPDVGGGNREAS